MRKYWIPAAALVLIPVVILAVQLASQHKVKPSPRVAQTTAASTSPNEEPLPDIRPGEGFDIPYEPADAKAAVAPYAIKPDLSNVSNLALFGKFTPEQRALLARNAFMVSPTKEEQLFFIYEENDYLNIPSFITTDTVLQVYHIFFDFTLRNMESEKLYAVLDRLTSAMADASARAEKELTSPEWKDAAMRNRAYFLVASSLMGRKPAIPSGKTGSLVKEELSLIAGHDGRSLSPLFGFELNYSQFIPRGHYTRSEKLERFFRTMIWYSYIPFPVGADEEHAWWQQIRQGLLISQMLHTTRVSGKPAMDLWNLIYEPTVFYVGSADDLTPMQYRGVIEKVYGKNATLADLQDDGKPKRAFAEIRKLPEPLIQSQTLPPGQSFRLMGQRYIPDSEMMQRLVKWPLRVWPMGLDVMAVLGSERAADILDNVYKEPQRWDEYLPRRNKLRAKFDATPQQTWQSNLYWGWLWGMDSLLDPVGDGYPSFMTNTAWRDKSLNTSLATWAQLRHDTILYAKQSDTAECGDGEGEQPPKPKGYVEPNVEFYNRLLWLTKASRAGLSARNLVTDQMEDKFRQFEDLITFLRDVSIKELTNRKLTDEEYDSIRVYGANLELLTLSVIDDRATNWFDITSETDRNMATVADVHSHAGSCLEEGVGPASEIFVIVPIEGKLYLTRGAVFSYYEFTHPENDRLTDEKWQNMLRGGKAPKAPVWTSSFLTAPKSKIPVPRKVRSTGC